MTQPSIDAQEMLRKLRSTQLPESDWLQVNEILRKLNQCIDAGDEAGAARAMFEIEPWTSTRRVGRGANPKLDQTPTYPASEDSADLLNRLIHHFGLDQPSDTTGFEHDPTG